MSRRRPAIRQAKGKQRCDNCVQWAPRPPATSSPAHQPGRLVQPLRRQALSAASCAGGQTGESRYSDAGGRCLLAIAAIGLTAGARPPCRPSRCRRPACNACHVGGFGPAHAFGRDFKMGGYTTRTDSFNLPVSAMFIAPMCAP